MLGPRASQEFGVIKTNDTTYTRRVSHLKLSKRELEILILSAEGLTDAGISQRLEISSATISTYWGRIRVKFGPMSRTELVATYLRAQASEAIESLKIENSKLSATVAANSQTLGEVETSLRLFQGLIENAPDAIIIVDESGQVHLANSQAEAMFGFGGGELVGMRVSELMPERHRAVHEAHRHQYVLNPVRKRMGEHIATPASRKDGSEFLIATALSATETSSGLLITCMIREVSPVNAEVSEN